MNDARIKFWLTRLLQEKCEDIGKLQERISVLSHQVYNFHMMDISSQKQVLGDMIDDMIGYRWNKEAEEIKNIRDEIE